MKSEIEINFQKRLQELISETGKDPFVWAKDAGIPGATFNRMWNEAKIPKYDHLIRISEFSGASLDWLLTGKELPSLGGVSSSSSGGFTIIPRVDIRLAAGSGAFNGDSIERVEDIPFTKEFLGGKLGRSSSDGLIILTAGGDSMDPLIADGDLVMVDKKRNALQDGVYAFVYGGLARVKRLRPTIQGDVELISQNPEYKDELLNRADLEDFHIIGKVVWCGHRFS
ncbi:MULTISPECIES: S24 family peptidase [unclassified Pseudovibrio]|uniref:LexA family transcriptional regulator n=1 Tax=unclassified Pseudovibrio TaxID=2627060 RepID=UPI0007AE6728|nr:MULTISPECIES: S24 family peptidase [unclassified Pseudovibrio]KZK97318.1 putative HTH-type transcriptional regulator [Pseudovibrio sp. W74]KZL09004.1 putative HTH-type transcriptional regulator [Pseudovibrio sp. Ad14]